MLCAREQKHDAVPPNRKGPDAEQPKSGNCALRMDSLSGQLEMPTRTKPEPLLHGPSQGQLYKHLTSKVLDAEVYVKPGDGVSLHPHREHSILIPVPQIKPTEVA